MSAETKDLVAQDLLDFLDQYFTSSTPQERVYDACVGLLEHFEVRAKTDRALSSTALAMSKDEIASATSLIGTYSVTSKEAK